MVLRAISINNFRLAEERFSSKLQLIETIFKGHFISALEDELDPVLSASDISQIFYDTTEILKCNKELITSLQGFNENNEICPVLQSYFKDVC